MKRFLCLFAFAMAIMTNFSCNKSENVADNPFFESEWDTPYGAPPFDRIKTYHFKPAFEQGMSLHNVEIDQIVNSAEEPTFENTVLAYDNSGEMLSRVATVFGMLSAADTDDEMQALSAEAYPAFAAHSDAISMNDKLFQRVKSVYDGREAAGLGEDEKRLTEKIYNDFVRSGALLSDEDKAQLKQINEKLSALGVDFGRNLLAETNAFELFVKRDRLEGLPSSVLDAAAAAAAEAGKKGEYLFTLQKSSMLPLLTYAEDRALREQIYKAYLKRGNNGNENDNKEIIAQMVSLRYQKAKLLGYNSYAHYVTADQMASTPDAVYELLEGVWSPALECAKAEVERMKPLFERDHGAEATFESWDWWYYAEKVRVADYMLEEERVREYLSLENAKGGIFFLANRLFGITFRPLKAPSYHEECEVYEVLDADDTPLGALYFDFHPRASKQGGAWCGTYVDQSYKDGKRVCPVVSVVCNFTPSVGSKPALLSIDEVETLFHEFGHALHNLFADVKYRGLAGVEGDFVELPSQILENWAFSEQMLKQYAVHYQTGDVMPDDMIAKIRKSSTFNEGFNTTELLAAALSDFDIHAVTSADKIDVDEFERKALNEKRGLISQIEPRYHYTYFSHIFDGGYSAGYYFYIWAEVLDKDAFQAFVESGDLFDKQTAERLRSEVLSRGGSCDGMDMYRAFRGADPDKNAMLVARGLVAQPEALVEEASREIARVDTREQARQRAELSRQKREAERQQAALEAEQAANAEQSEE